MRIGDSVWFCKQYSEEQENGESFGEPIEIKTRFKYFTVMSKNGYLDIIELGAKSSSYLRAVAQPYNLWKDVFHKGDRFYCNGVSPSSKETYNGQNANYVVDDIAYGNIAIILTLKEIVSNGN